MKKSTLYFLSKITFSIGCVSYLAIYTGAIDNISSVTSELTIGHWCIALFFSMVTRVLASVRMKVLADFYSANMTILTVTKDVFVANFFNTVMPVGTGDLYRMKRVKDDSGSYKKGGYVVVFDRLFGMAALILYAICGYLFFRIEFASMKLSQNGYTMLLAILVAVPVLTGVLLYWRPKKIEGIIQDVFRLLKDHRTMLKCMFLSLVGFFSTLIGIYVIGQELGIGWPFYYYITIVPLVEIAAAVPITIGGLGLRELGYSTLFVALGVSSTKAIALGLVQFSIIIALAMIGLTIFLSDLMGRPKEKTSES